MKPFSLAGRRILFVGGKGGVGKTTTASTLALKGAEAGRRTLLVSTDPAHNLGDLFGIPIGDGGRDLLPRLRAIEIDPEAEVNLYLDGVKRSMREFVGPDMHAEIERQIELTRHSPGSEEAALMGRMARIMGGGEGTFDLIVFDTAPTGHTLRLLALPEVMTAWMDGLLRSRERSDTFGRALERLGGASPPEVHDSARPGDELSWFQETEEGPPDKRGQRIREILLERRRSFATARRVLLDRELTAFVMVLIPEKLPILETEKAVAALQAHKVPIAGLVVNRVLPNEALGDFLESRRGQEGEYLARIDRLFSHLPQVRVPLLRRDVVGMDGLREVGHYLPTLV